MRYPAPSHPLRHSSKLPVLAAVPLLVASLLQVGPARAQGSPSFPIPSNLSAKGSPSLPVPASLSAATSFVVTTTGDGPNCSMRSFSLRCAISAANASTATGTKSISFGIPTVSPGCTVQTIQGRAVKVCTLRPAQDLPAVSANNVTITGYSQSGAVRNTNAIAGGDNAVLTIQIDGSRDLSSMAGIVLGGTNDLLTGLSVTHFDISAKSSNGILLMGTRDTLQGDFVGVTPAGQAAANYYGVYSLAQGPALIGGIVPMDRNVISGNSIDGILSVGPVTIQGNLIGTNVAGTAAIGNGYSGAVIGFPSVTGNTVTIGGISAAARNVISGNGTSLARPALQVFCSGIIEGNFIGTNARGSAAVPNNGDGIALTSTRGTFTVGGATVGARNVISGNAGNGIDLSGVSNATIEGNWIGMGSAGAKLGNAGNGISVHADLLGNGSNEDTIGLPGAGNIIMNNGGNGVIISPPTVGIAVRGNSIANNPLGISLNGEYPTGCLNGPRFGPNDYVPCPVVAFASTSTVRGIATPGSTVDVYSAQASPGDQGHGEGVAYLGTATAQSNGNWTLARSSGQVAVGQSVTATATAIGPSSKAPETSEFSANTTVSGQVQPAVFVANGGNNTVTQYAPGGNGNINSAATLTGANGLNAPTALALDAAGNLFVANSGNSSITEYAPGVSGTSTSIATLAGSNTGLATPYAVTLDRFGRLYVANQPANTITVYLAGASGNVAPLATISGTHTGLSSPVALTVDGQGNLWVANASSNSLTEYAAGATGDAKPIATIAGSTTSLNHPDGLAQNARGNLLVSNQFGESVTEYPSGSNGNVTPSVTISGANTRLDFPVGIDLDTAGNIYVANQFGNSITEFAPTASGNVSPLATITGPSTGLSSPGGLAVAPPLSVLTTTLPSGRAGQHYAAVLKAGEGRSPYTWTLVKGTLPNGLHLSSAGVIFGTPTAKGTGHFTVRVTDSSHPAMFAEQALTTSVSS